MRIGVLVPQLDGGGAEAVARQWADGLRRRGHQVVALRYLPPSGGVSDELWTVEDFPGRSRAARWVQLPRWVRRTAARHQLDCVVSLLDFSNITALRALHGRRTVVISEHSLPTLLWRQEGLPGRVKRALATVLYRHADAVLAVSHPVAADLRTALRVPAERLSVLPNAVPAASCPVAERASPGLRRVLLVGRLSPEKNPQLLLDVLERLPGTPSLVVGDGPLRAALSAEAERRRLPVSFAGWVADWPSLVVPGDCLLVTSHVEGLGNVLVEAAAAGVPAVAPSAALGVADAVVPGVTAVLAGSAPDELATALLDAARLRPAQPAVAAWLARFAPDEVCARLEGVVERAVGRPVDRSVRRTVVHVGPSPDADGGGMAAVLRAYRGMRLDGVEMRFLTSYVDRQRLASIPRFVWAVVVLALLRPPRSTLLHAHLSFGGSFVREGSLVLLARARRMPVVVTLHGSDFSEFSEAHPRLVRTVLDAADRLVVLGESVRPLLPPALRPRATVVPNPAGSNPRTAAPGPAQPVALLAGELSLRKGVDVLLDVWPRVRAAVPGARLVLAGPVVDAPVREVEGVEWRGPLSHAQVGEALLECRVAVLPSRREVMPMFLLEAMTLGRPVVATDTGVVRDLVGDGGLVVAPENRDALTAAVVTLLGDPGGAAVTGRRGQARARALFSPEDVARRLQALYDDLGRTTRTTARRPLGAARRRPEPARRQHSGVRTRTGRA